MSPAPAAEPMDEVETEARLLHDLLGREREELEAAGSGRIRARRLELEIQERRLGPQAAGERAGEQGRGGEPLDP